MIIALFSLLMYQTTENRFSNYIGDRYEAEKASLVEAVESAYQSDNQWDTDILSSLTQNSMHAMHSSGMLMRVVDEAGNEIYSQSNEMEDHMHMMSEEMMGVREGWTEERVDLYSQGEVIGSAVLSYPGFQGYTVEEAEFIDDLTMLIITMGIFSIIVACIIAYLISRRLSDPIAKTSLKTQKIAQGQIEGAALTDSEEIRELYQLEQSVAALAAQLAEQKRIRNQMISDLAHEVRTPLTTLQGNIEAMIDGVWEATPERLNSLNRQVIRLTHLIKMIDQLEDVEESNNELTLERFDIKEFLSMTLLAFEALAEEKNIRLELEAEFGIIEADRNKLEQVMTNLLSNAIKFTSKGGRISVLSLQTSDEQIITVKDNGEGIPENKQKYIFERFYQVEPSRNSELQGQGLGLAVVKEIINAHHGTITVDSQEGKGTTFKIFLPK